jgi:3-methyladenine DNA glycosylase AlkC
VSCPPSLPEVSGLGWSKVLAIARDLAAGDRSDELVEAAIPLLDAAEVPRRLLAVCLLGYTAGRRPANLAILHDRVPADQSWEVQEALAQAFDAYCAATGYEAALPTIDAWLDDPHANVRRAVSEGLRPWTARGRTYFARHPEEAIRRLASLRADPSDYVCHSAGNALRDIRRAHPQLIDAETATWNLDDPREGFTFKRVLAVH